jgi:hypothetical protein
MNEQPVYKYQCNRCFIVSGEMTRGYAITITCCNGEPMTPIRIEIKEGETNNENRTRD